MSTPNELDAARRVARTIVQTGIPTFLALAGIVPYAIQQAHGVVSPDVYAFLVGLAAFITASAAVLARAMADPTINAALTRFKLNATTTTVPELDTQTRVLRLTSQNSGEFFGTPAH